MIPVPNRPSSRLLEATAFSRSDGISHPRKRVDARRRGETGGLFEQDPSLSPLRLHLLLRYKKLEKHRFPWPQDERAVAEITEQQLRWLLAGIDFWNAHTKLAFSYVS